MAKAKMYTYWNLHKHTYSTMLRGKVISHRDFLVVLDATFVVRPAGHAKVLRTGVKNVHAFVVGMTNNLTIDDTQIAEMGAPVGSAHIGSIAAGVGGVPISYNPKKAGHFIRLDTGEKVESASVVEMHPSRKMLAWGVK